MKIGTGQFYEAKSMKIKNIVIFILIACFVILFAQKIDIYIKDQFRQNEAMILMPGITG
jgi:hypothetical protein